MDADVSTRTCGRILVAVTSLYVSVCLSVCNALIFESLDVEISPMFGISSQFISRLCRIQYSM